LNFSQINPDDLNSLRPPLGNEARKKQGEAPVEPSIQSVVPGIFNSFKSTFYSLQSACSRYTPPLLTDFLSAVQQDFFALLTNTELSVEEKLKVDQLKKELLSSLKTDCIRSKGLKKYERMFVAREKIEEAKEHPKILAEAVLLLFKEGLSRKHKDHLRLSLQSIFPDIALYIDYDPSEAGSERFFHARGIEVLVDYLSSPKKKAITLPCTVFALNTDFYSYLLREFDNPQAVWPQTSIVRNVDFQDTAGHFTPFYITKEEGAYHLYNTDSIGEFLESPGAGAYLQFIEALQKKEVPAQLHLYRSRRQVDEYNCPIFSLHDIIQFCKYDIRNIKEEKIEGKEFGSIQEIKELPAPYYIPTQSSKLLSPVLQRIQKELSQEEDPKGKIKHKTLKKVKRKIYKYAENDFSKEDKRVYYCFAERQGDKLEGIVWKKVIAQFSGI
jgi:hypothetical protein